MTAENAKPRYPCWCNGADGCDNASPVPFGLCAECSRFGHRPQVRMGLTDADMEDFAREREEARRG